jgi:hypothetical protein
MHISSRETPAVRCETSSNNVRSSINFGLGLGRDSVIWPVSIGLSPFLSRLARLLAPGRKLWYDLNYQYVTFITILPELNVTLFCGKYHNTFNACKITLPLKNGHELIMLLSGKERAKTFPDAE